ncbi:Hypothetical predicted protein [Mytilus galloprovincialis]|uniref:Reverse transcriptase domain-containing protein n=1 Tax=Mytilus galloprovincialis TaxID=29158 RepID=A0A8B6FZ34_MYTGA|nr:Hypothetical predicted protein [Mytilus galloprovincialis]
MDTFESAIKLVTSKSFMASIDLRHAYYSVPIAEEHQKFLRFYWNGKLFQYTCLPNGISSAPRIFTKLLKPVYSSLRVLGHVNVGYIDDSLLLGETIEECNKNVNDTIELMSKLGFVIHEDKSVFQPSKQIIFLGNIIDSENMIITLTADKKQNLVKECKWLLQRNLAKIRDVAKVIGLIVSSFSAVEFVCLFVSSFQFIEPVHFQNQRGRCKRSSNSSILADTNLVSETNAVVNRQCNPIVLPKNKKIMNLPHDPQSVHPLHKKMKLIACLVSGVASENEDFLKKQPTYSCRLGNQVQRNSTKCISGNGSNIVTKKQINCFQISVGTVLEFFTTLFKEGNLGYSSLNLARGALSSLGLTIDSIPVGRHAMVIRYMKGIFNLRPPRPRYESTWDVSKVLQFFA